MCHFLLLIFETFPRTLAYTYHPGLNMYQPIMSWVEEEKMKTLNQNPQYVLAAALAVFITSLLHELAHWVTGELLGNRMGMNLNAAYPVNGDYLQPWHAHIVTVAGPLFTVFQGFVVYLLM